jgi:demethylmenaquinone methyltransferase/2-methoxy-6-polyprenyl-1,4-benzoquinol methylase
MRRKAYFNNAAESWDEKFCTPELVAFLEKLIPRFGLKFEQNVLDVGTGTGVLIPFLLEVVGPSGSITAIDYAEKMVEICRSKYSHFPNVTIELQDVEELNLLSESFDAVTCFGLFPHIEKREEVLHHLNRVLRTGGKFIIAHALSSAEIKAHHSDASSAVAHDNLPEKLEMKQLLKDAGFTDIYIKDEPGCYLCLSTKP